MLYSSSSVTTSQEMSSADRFVHGMETVLHNRKKREDVEADQLQTWYFAFGHGTMFCPSHRAARSTGIEVPVSVKLSKKDRLKYIS